MISCKIFGKPFLCVFMLVLNIFCVSSVRGTVSNSLRICIVARSVLCADLGVLRS